MHVKSWNSIIVGHQGDSAAEVKDMYVKLITQLPEFLFMKKGWSLTALFRRSREEELPT